MLMLRCHKSYLVNRPLYISIANSKLFRQPIFDP